MVEKESGEYFYKLHGAGLLRMQYAGFNHSKFTLIVYPMSNYHIFVQEMATFLLSNSFIKVQAASK